MLTLNLEFSLVYRVGLVASARSINMFTSSVSYDEESCQPKQRKPRHRVSRRKQQRQAKAKARAGEAFEDEAQQFFELKEPAFASVISLDSLMVAEGTCCENVPKVHDDDLGRTLVFEPRSIIEAATESGTPLIQRRRLRREDSITEGFYVPNFIESRNPLADDETLKEKKVNVRIPVSLEIKSSVPARDWLQIATTPLSASFGEQKKWWATLPNKQYRSPGILFTTSSDKTPEKASYDEYMKKRMRDQEQVNLGPDQLSPLQIVPDIAEHQTGQVGPDLGQNIGPIHQRPRALSDTLQPPLEHRSSFPSRVLAPIATFSHQNENEDQGSIIKQYFDPASDLIPSKIAMTSSVMDYKQMKPAEDNRAARILVTNELSDNADLASNLSSGHLRSASGTKSSHVYGSGAANSSSESRNLHQISSSAPDPPAEWANSILLQQEVSTGPHAPPSSIPPSSTQFGFHTDKSFSNHLSGPQLSRISRGQDRSRSKLSESEAPFGGKALGQLNVWDLLSEMSRHPEMAVQEFLDSLNFSKPSTNSMPLSVQDQESNVFNLEDSSNRNPQFVSTAECNTLRQSPEPVWEQSRHSKSFKARLSRGERIAPILPNTMEILSGLNPDYWQLPYRSAVICVETNEATIRNTIQKGIWTSSVNGNRLIQQVWDMRKGADKVVLIFSVNNSQKFCGLAELSGPKIEDARPIASSASERQGFFPVLWVYCKDVSKKLFHHLHDPSASVQSINFSQDATILADTIGREMVQLYVQAPHHTNILVNDPLSRGPAQSHLQRGLSVHNSHEVPPLNPAAAQYVPFKSGQARSSAPSARISPRSLRRTRGAEGLYQMVNGETTSPGNGNRVLVGPGRTVGSTNRS
ncbi:MAG: hypothetical protein M1819_005611 [Sarea resinae]|nr:MAG: hypothetical protein M1819_005611 [Sarea resinae]